MSKKNFTKERIKDCEKLMLPEIKQMLSLSLEEKIDKTKEIIKEALVKYPKMGLGFSGGTDSLVLLHLALPLTPKDMPIIFVNTRMQFQKTYDFIDKIIKEWKIENFIEVKPAEDKMQQFVDKFGLKTAEFTTVCCNYHKITPLMDVIKELDLDAFMAGIRGVEHEERAKETLFSPRETHFRVHPLLFWTQEDVLDYVKTQNVESNPLYAEGYTSLGCTHCTDKNTDPNAHERAGRGVVREEIMAKLRELGYT